MTKEQTSAVVGIVISAVIALLAVFGYNFIVVQPGFAVIEQEQAALEQEQAAIVAAMQGGAEQGLVGADVTGFNSVDLAGALSVGTFFDIVPSTVISVASGATITPLGTLQGLTSGSAVTTSTSTAIANGTTSGQLLILFNKNATDAITIDGAGGNVECGGNQAIGPTDHLVLQWQTDDWECVAKFGF